jgi:hypothetical protein
LSKGCTKIGDVPKSPVPILAALLPSAGIIILQIARVREQVPKARPPHTGGLPSH